MIKVKKEQLVIFVLIFSAFTFGAENSPLEGGDIEPPPAANIDIHIPFMLVIGMLLALFVMSYLNSFEQKHKK